MRALLSVEFWITLKTYLKGAPFYNALQTALHVKAKESPSFRFYALYDKVHRKDILAFAYECCKANGGAAGVDGQKFEDIESQGVEQWLKFGSLSRPMQQSHGSESVDYAYRVFPNALESAPKCLI